MKVKTKLILIALAGIIARLIFYLLEKNSPLFLFPIIDESEFMAVAGDITGNHFLYPYYFFHPPLYSYFIAICKLMGFGLAGIVVLQFLMGITGSCLLFLALNKSFPKIAFITALLWSIYPLELFMETRFLSEAIYLFWGFLLFYLFTLNNSFKYKYLLAGLVTGLAIITKTQFLLFWLMFIVFSLILKRISIKNLVVYAALSLVFPLAFVAHNAYHTDGRLLSISANGSVNFYIGNSHNIDSTLNIRPQEWQSDFYPSLYEEAGIQFFKTDSTDTKETFPYLLSGYLVKKTFRENKDLSVPVTNLFRKILIVLHPYETPRDFDLYEYKRWNPYLRFTLPERGLYTPLALFLFAGLLFLFIRWKKLIQNETGLLLILMVITGLLPSVLFFNAFRYRLAAVPFLLFLGIRFYSEFYKDRKWMTINILFMILLGSPLIKSLRFQQIPKSETYDFYADGFLDKGHTRQAQRFYDMAATEAEKEPKPKKSRAKTYVNKAVLSDQLGNPELALQDLNKAIEADPNSAMAYYNRAIALHRQKEYQKAINDYSKSIDLDFNDEFYLAASYYGRALSYVKLEKLDQALDDFNKSLKINPSNPVAYSNRGVLLGRFNRLPEAINDFTQAIQLDSTNAKYYADRAIAYLNKAETENAFHDIQHAIRLNPGDGKSYYIRGLLKLDYGKPKAACSDLQKAVDLGFEAARPDLVKYCK